MARRLGYGTRGLGEPWWFRLWGAFSVLLGLTFWGTLIYAGWHFAAKYW